MPCINPTLINNPPATAPGIQEKLKPRTSGIMKGSELAGDYAKLLTPALESLAPRLGCPAKDNASCANAGQTNVNLKIHCSRSQFKLECVGTGGLAGCGRSVSGRRIATVMLA